MIDNRVYPWRSQAFGVRGWIYWARKPDKRTRVVLATAPYCPRKPNNEPVAMFSYESGADVQLGFGTICRIERNPHYRYRKPGRPCSPCNGDMWDTIDGRFMYMNGKILCMTKTGRWKASR